jgi:hypothetical protein
MKSYEVIVRDYLHDYLRKFSPFVKWSNNLRTEVLSFIVCAEADIMRCNSSATVLDLTAYTTDFLHVPKDCSLKEWSQVTSVAKQLDPSAQSNGFENIACLN